MILQADAKGLEVVAAAYLSQDKVMMEEIRSGEDLHINNQKKFNLPTKLIAKTFMFRLIYGGTHFANDPDFMPVSKSVDFWNNVIFETYQKYQGLGEWHSKLMKEAGATGMYICPTGRTYKYELDKYGNLPRTTILNYPVQGLGATLVALARVELHRGLKLNPRLRMILINTIHDSIVMDVPIEEETTAKNITSDVFYQIPALFQTRFGKEFNLPMRCEFK